MMHRIATWALALTVWLALWLAAPAAHAVEAAVNVTVDFICGGQAVGYEASSVTVTIAGKPRSGSLINVGSELAELRIDTQRPDWQVKEVRYLDIAGGRGPEVFRPFSTRFTQQLIFSPRPSRSAVSSLAIVVDTCTVPMPGSGMVRVKLVSSQSCSGAAGEALAIAPSVAVGLGRRNITTTAKGIVEFDIPAGSYPVSARFKDYALGRVLVNGLPVAVNERGELVVALSDPVVNLEVRMFTCDQSGQATARAVISQIGGQIRIQRGNAQSGAIPGMMLRDGDRVQISGTAVLSWIGGGEIRFDDPRGATLIIGPDGQPSGSQAPPSRGVQILDGLGSFFFPRDRDEPTHKFGASRHSVVIGIKGTRFVFGAHPNDARATLVGVSEGVVSVSSLNAGFAPFDLHAGQQVVITEQGPGPVTTTGTDTNRINPLFEIDTNRGGSDYASFDLPRAEPQQCLDRCKGDNRCLAWTYVKPGVQGANARCYLKSPAPPATANNCCISGTFTRILDGGAQMEVDTNRQGSDFANIEMQVAVPQLCYERCKGDSRCAAWTFVKPGVQGPKARCYLKNPAPAPTPNTCCVSGVMTGVAPPPTAPATLPGGDVRYDNPALNGVLVDHCASWGANCGQGGADQFCRRQGHGPARSFQVRNPGRTVVLADNQICEGGNCVGFTQVVCVGSGQVSPPSPPVPPPVQPPPPPPPQPPGASCWLTSPTFLETGEHQWEGVYVRRGSSNVFDVTYTKGSQVDRGELTLDLVSPTEVRIHRTRSQNGYTAVFGARIETENLARGMYPGGTRFDLRCTSTSLRSGVLPPPVTPLSPPRPPVIEALGDVWNEFEGSERAIWTRRSGSNTFDASWSNGRVRAVLEMSLNGNQVTIRRSQSTDGYECVYTGTLQGREASGTFGCNRFSGQLPWRATIDGGGTGTATAPTGAPRLLGCFRDPNSPFDLDGHLGRSAQNTPQSCINTCANLGFKFAGVQYSESCLCGNSYGRFGPANNCNMPCTGDSNQICGGGNANSVYSTGVTTSPTTGPVAPEVRTPPQPPAPPAPPPPPRPPAGAFVLKLQSTKQDPSGEQWGVSNGRITYSIHSGDYRATGLYTWNPPPPLIGPEGFTLSLVAQCETGRLQGGGLRIGNSNTLFLRPGFPGKAPARHPTPTDAVLGVGCDPLSADGTSEVRHS